MEKWMKRSGNCHGASDKRARAFGAACVLAGLAALLAAPDARAADGYDAWQAAADSKFALAAGRKAPVPDIAFTASEMADLAAGKPVTRLLDGGESTKRGYLRVIVDKEPPTVWRIVTDIDHFDQVSPEYPENKGRRTFMPYVFDGASCREGGKQYLYHLLVLPLVSPRHFTIERAADREAFPWYVHWKDAPAMKCQDKLDPEMDAHRADAVVPAKNLGAWVVNPLPESMVTRPGDRLKSDVTYYVDSNPGGDIGKIAFAVNMATKTALPAVADSLKFHAGRWEAHMKNTHPGLYEAWKAEIEAYRTWVSGKAK
ncbi:hypothetical protein K8I61_08710 [bacterium]|nr:hypothetical protein [bacterium]